MPLNLDVQLLVQAVLYLAVFVTGFAISIPLGVTRVQMKGCILFAGVDWQNSERVVVHPSSDGNCNFPIYVCIIVCIFYGLAMSIYFGYAVLKRNPEIGFRMWVMPAMLVTAVICIVMVVAGFLISVGFQVFCDRLTSGATSVGETFIKTCLDVQSPAITWDTGADSRTLFTYLTAAQLAVWVGVLMWGAQLGLYIVRFIRLRLRQRQSQTTSKGDSFDANVITSDKVRIAALEPTA